MFWFRIFALGFLGAFLVLLITPQHAHDCALLVAPASSVASAATASRPQRAAADVTVVDVAPTVTGDMLAQMIVLAANERIVAVDDVPVTSGVVALATHDLAPHQYIDVTIGDDRGSTRRALVLLR